MTAKKPVWIGVGVAIVALIVVLILIFSGGGDEPMDGPGDGGGAAGDGLPPEGEQLGAFEGVGFLFRSEEPAQVLFLKDPAARAPVRLTVLKQSVFDEKAHLFQIVKVAGVEYGEKAKVVMDKDDEGKELGEREILAKPDRLLIQKVIEILQPKSGEELNGIIGQVQQGGNSEAVSALCELYVKQFGETEPGLASSVYYAWAKAQKGLGHVARAIEILNAFIAKYPLDNKVADFRKHIQFLTANHLNSPNWGYFKDNREALIAMDDAELKKVAPKLEKAYTEAAKIPGSGAERTLILQLLSRAGATAFLASVSTQAVDMERVLAVSNLAKSPPTPDTVKAMLGHLADKNKYVRQTAAKYLGRAKEASAVGPLVQLLKSDPLPEVKAEAAGALGRIGGAEAVAALKGALASGDTVVRGGAILGLGRAGEKEALKAHLPNETDEDLKKRTQENIDR